MSRRAGLLLAAGALLGLAAAGAVWGLILGVATLLAVAAASGLAGQLVLGGRADPAQILVAGGVGSLLGVGVSRLAGWPALVTLGGVPLVWAVAGAVVVLVALRAAPAGRRIGSRGG